MVLLTNGDSWTRGDYPAQTLNSKSTKSLDWYDVPNLSFEDGRFEHQSWTRYEFYESELWPKVLGRKLKMETLNAGFGGSCNRSISERTINLVSDLINKGETDIFCVIGWSSSQRVSIFEVKDNPKIEGGSERICKVQYRPYSNNDVSKVFYDNTNLYQIEHLHSVINLQNFLKVNNINYLMYNAFDKFELEASTNLSKLVDLNHWVDGDMVSAHFKEYIISTNPIKHWGTTDNPSEWFITQHPTDKSHIEWGEYLHKYIINNNII